MKNLFHQTRTEPNFRGILQNAETADSKLTIETDELEETADNVLSRWGLDTQEIKDAWTILFGDIDDLFALLDKESSDSDDSKESNDDKSNNNSTKNTRSMENIKSSNSILANARLLKGTNEANDGDDDRQKIAEMHKAGNLPGASYKTPWCASFVSFVLQKSGIKVKGSARARDWLKKGNKVDNIKNVKAGDVVVYKRGNDKNKGHVGIATGEIKNGKPVIIAGNTSDTVREYVDNREILGIRSFT